MGDITVAASSAIQVAFKNCETFTKCITKNDGGDFNLVMVMYNLWEYSSNYSDTTSGLWFYSKDETTDFDAIAVNNNNFKSAENNAKFLENTVAQPATYQSNGILKTATISVTLKYLERSVYWNDYKTKTGNKNTTNEYRYFLEPTFLGVHRLFVSAYSKAANDAKRYSARKYFWTKRYYQKLWHDCQQKELIWPTHWFWCKRYEEIKLTSRHGEILVQDICWIMNTSTTITD